MFARKRLDICGKDLLAGLAACAGTFDEEGPRARVERVFARVGEESPAIACLSVRSGLDLYLREIALPKGSEVLMSALTIPDMWKIVEHHGLVPVPVDLDPRTLAPTIERWRAAASPRTRAVVLAHLFGARVPLEPLASLARERGWLLLEDCAQSWTGDDDRGNPLADVSMFSFGPIKTATALAGGVLVVRDRAVLERMRAAQARYPVQDRRKYFTRILKYSSLVALTKRPLYTAFVRWCRARGKDHDQIIQGSVRGFAGGEFFEKIRHRPSAPLLRLLVRRLESQGRSRVEGRVDGRVARAQRLLRGLAGAQGRAAVPGADLAFHSHWVFTLLVEDPERVVVELRAAGFDATRAATLRSVPVPADRPDLEPREAQRILSRTVYAPCYPEMSERAVDRMAEVIVRAVERSPQDLAEVVLTPAQPRPALSSSRSRR